ncbi:MAG TPA: very short patch repair endonuclease [bacterium]|nr:very short patch repair endonuclease [bacterium]
MDNLTPEQRKKNMSNIRSFGTAPEIKMIRELNRRKIYFSKNVASILGKPDIVFKRKKIAVFIDSDFWHGHKSRGTIPKTNYGYWKEKIENNRKRDRRVTNSLKKDGWIVLRFWEYDINNNFEKCVEKLIKEIDKKQ